MATKLNLSFRFFITHQEFKAPKALTTQNAQANLYFIRPLKCKIMKQSYMYTNSFAL